MIEIETEIRMAELSDYPLILNSWVSQLRNIFPNNHALDYRSKQSDKIKSILSKSITLIANVEGIPDQICSFLTYSSFMHKNLVIHYAYTKYDGRQQGHVSKLIHFACPERLPIIFTHPASNANTMKYLCSKYIFDPSILEIINA